MKNILLATTALVMTAGMASAEVTFSGSATAGIWNDADGDNSPYASVSLGVAATTTTDSGLTVSLATSIAEGTSVSLSTAIGNGVWALTTADGSMGNPAVTVSGDFGSVKVKRNAIDDYFDSDVDHDVEIKTAMGPVSISLATSIDSSKVATVTTATTASGVQTFTRTVTTEAEVGDYSAKVVFAQGDITVTVIADEDNNNKSTLAYAMGEYTVSMTNKNTDSTSVTTNSAKIAYASGPLSASISGNLSSDSAALENDYDVVLGYAADASSVAIAFNEAGDYNLTTSYSLGGGAAINAGTSSSEEAYVGVSMSF
jgi:outer membrane protein OmpU